MDLVDTDDPMGDQDWHAALASLHGGPYSEAEGMPVAYDAGENDVELLQQTGDDLEAHVASTESGGLDELADLVLPDIVDNIKTNAGQIQPIQNGVDSDGEDAYTEPDEYRPDDTQVDDDDKSDEFKEVEQADDSTDDSEEGKVENAVYSYDSSSESVSSLPVKPLPIEVVLPKLIDPEAYVVLPPSETVDRILEEIEFDGETFFSVEYTDGRIEQVAFDDVLQKDRGARAVKKFVRDSRFNLTGASGFTMSPNLQSRPEDDYSETDEAVDEIQMTRKQRTRPVRKSRTRSRQISQDLGLAEDTRVSRNGTHNYSDELLNDFDDSLMYPKITKDDDDEDDESMSHPKTTSRLTRSKKSVLKHYNVEESADELSQVVANDNSGTESEDFFVTSDINPKKRKSKRTSQRRKKVARHQPTTRFDEREYSIEFEPIGRRSGRANKSSRSMKDPELEDEFLVITEQKGPAVPKIAAVKELFRPVKRDEPFRKVHTTTCETCKGNEDDGRGMFVFCQGCSNTYHKGCIGLRSQRDHRVTKIKDDEFVLQCKYCIGIYSRRDVRAPVHAECQVCHKEGASCKEFSTKKTTKQEEKLREQNDGKDPIVQVCSQLIDNPDNVLFRCTNCHRGFHQAHLPPRNSAPKDNEASRLREYSWDWNCLECSKVKHKIQTLVAWRPVKTAEYTQGLQHFDYKEQEIEFLVKWDERSHFHDTWMPGPWVYGVAPGAMRNAFYRRDASFLPKMDTKSAVEEEWILPDVILEVKYRHSNKPRSKAEERGHINDIRLVHVKFQGLGYDEAVWDEPPPRDSVWGEAPWDAFEDAFDEYLNGQYFAHIPESKLRERIARYRSLEFEKECELQVQPSQLKRGELMRYQLEGVNWLLYKFHQQENAILADEMGLGKTVQIVAFLAALALHQPKCWPFLVVVPNATCPNWRREIKKWVPDLRVVTYHGGKVAQQLAYEHELFPGGKGGGMKAHVVIMSFEAATYMKAQFSGTRWAGLIVDEGQRLKNEDSLLYRALSDMRFPCRILLTGTPLQNNKRELFNLLQFIDPTKDAEELDLKYAELNNENLPELHNLIRPYFLRRTKLQVLGFLPPMAQIILPVSMSVLQEKLCKSIMARNAELLQAIMYKGKMKAGERKSLSNILMELRQCLCHPFCFNADVEDRSASPEQMHRNLVAASGKLMLLNIMLPKLKEKGHRVLIFSQFLHSLTILEDFLTGMGMEHLRIDGSISALEKQRRIDAYNAEDSPYFAMLLSTRAGGVGINLATADTVIIYDPDFNPHQDIQALSRAHRIGQKNKVLCFQLTTKDTAEEKIMQLGRKKMALDHALIESMDAAEDAGGDLESILKHGASALFRNSPGEERIVYDAASVDKLLDRSSIEKTKSGDDSSAENQFSFARVWQNNKNELVVNDEAADTPEAEVDDDLWESILRARKEEHDREQAAQKQEYGRGARRKTVNDVRYDRHVGYDDFSDTENTVLTTEQQPQFEGDVPSDMDVDGEYSDAGANEEEDDDSETGSRRQTASGTPAKSSDEMHQASSRSTNSTGPTGPTGPAVKVFQLQHTSQSAIPPPTIPSLTFPTSQRPLPPNLPTQAAQEAESQALAQIMADMSRRQPPPLSVVRPPIRSNQPSKHVSQSAQQQPAVKRGRPPKVKLADQQQREAPKKKQQGTIQERLMEEMGAPNVHIAFYLSMSRNFACVMCGGKHAVSTSCIDFNSEVSLRLAIDAYRGYASSTNTHFMENMKVSLRKRLMEVVDGRVVEMRTAPVAPVPPPPNIRFK